MRGLSVLVLILICSSTADAALLRRRGFLFRNRFTHSAPAAQTPRPQANQPTPKNTQSALLTKPDSELVPAQLELKKYIGEDETLISLLLQWKAQHPALSVNQLALAFAVREMAGKSIESKLDPRLCDESRNAAWEMSWFESQTDKQGKKRAVKSRTAKLNPHNRRLAESSGESWADGSTSVMRHARACIRNMMEDPASQRQLNNRHDRFCLSMFQAKSGAFYCSGLFGDDI